MTDKKLSKEKLLNTLDALYDKLGTQILNHEEAVDLGVPAADYKDSCNILNDAIRNINKTLEFLSIQENKQEIESILNKKK